MNSVDTLKNSLSNYIAAYVKNPVLVKTCEWVLSTPEFLIAPAAENHHHAYKHGLLAHTEEVTTYALMAAPEHCNREILVVACIWHDFGKLYDYTIEENGEIKSTETKRRVGHISNSTLDFSLTSINLCHSERNKENIITKDIGEQIQHCILAHHGRTEWGSPVEPQTVEALLLHQADMLSAKFGATKDSLNV